MNTTADLLRKAADVIDENRTEPVTPVTAIRIAGFLALGATPQARELANETIVRLAVSMRYGIDLESPNRFAYAERLLNRWDQLHHREDVAAELRKAADRIEKPAPAPGVSVRGGPDLDPATETEYQREKADDMDGGR